MHKTAENKQSYYDTLKIAPDASTDDIREAYLNLARIYHPDANPYKKTIAASRFRLINEAYDTLKTPESRRLYDKLLSQKATKKRASHKHAHNDNQKPRSEGFFSGLINLIAKPQSPSSTMRTRK